MFTADEVAEKLGVSKVTVYAKLKKFEHKVAIVQGKKSIDDELFNLIKQDLKVKDIVRDSFTKSNDSAQSNEDIVKDNSELISINKDLTDTLIKQLDQKDKQIEELNNRIAELHKLIENSQVLLKEEQKKNTSQLLLEEHLENLDSKINDVRERMENRKDLQKKKGFFRRRS